MNATQKRYRLGIDIGGTFTDIVLLDSEGAVLRQKVLSTPDDYAQGILTGLEPLLPCAPTDVVHGTTVATNTILEGKGALTGLITTRGFRDVLEIGRLRYPRLYDLSWEKPPPLVPRRLRREVEERIAADGQVVCPLDVEGASEVMRWLLGQGIEALAICLINAYANPAHEQRLGQLARDLAPDLPVSLSSEVLPEIKEYERTSTTVINATLQPIVSRYVSTLSEKLVEAFNDPHLPLYVMQSNGGVVSAATAAGRPIHIIESGPTAGVIAALALSEQAGLTHVLTLDMGGTTAKASLIESGQVTRSPEYEVGGGVSAGTGFRVANAVFGALAQAAPERVPACEIGGDTGVSIGGYERVVQNGKTHLRGFVFLEFLYGSWGGRPDKDGIDGAASAVVNFANNPVEVLEAELPLRVEQYAYLPDTGGPGQYRGGLSLVRDFRLLAEEATLQIRADRTKYRPYGLHGGRSGAPSRNILNPDGEARELPPKPTLTIRRGDLFRHVAAGAGGWGDPFQRDPQAILADVLAEKVTLAQARDAYGVVIDPQAGQVDVAATQRCRASGRDTRNNI